MREGQAFGLVLDGPNDVRVRMAEAADGGTPRCVKIAFAAGVADLNALTLYGLRQVGMNLAVENVGHGRFTFSGPAGGEGYNPRVVYESPAKVLG